MNANALCDYQVATMGQADVDLAVDWARQEGWNPGLSDPSVFWRADPSGFFMGRCAGEPVASISAVKYGDDFGFIGLYIVRPSWRGKGLGWALWQHAMASLDGRNIGLDGVLAQQDNYRKCGFVFAHRNVRYAGLVGALPPVLGAAAGELMPLASIPFETVEAFDRAHFPAPRSGFLSDWIEMPGAQALGIVTASAMSAYGAVRPCHQGYKIGPLCAKTPSLASHLFDALCSHVPPGSEVFIDVPQPNEAALVLAQSRGMSPVFETARMYTGGLPPLPLGDIYGITSLELG